MTNTYKTRHALGTGHIMDRTTRKPARIEDIEIEVLPEGIEFCEFAGTKYDCCKKPCFKKENEYCGVRNFIDKYKL